jgi:hypothetical protein
MNESVVIIFFIDPSLELLAQTDDERRGPHKSNGYATRAPVSCRAAGVRSCGSHDGVA